MNRLRIESIRKSYILISLVILLNVTSGSTERRIAIIGKSFSGALCAYYLRELNPNSTIVIDVYNHNPNTAKYTVLNLHSKFNENLREIISKNQLDVKRLYPNLKPIMYNEGVLSIVDIRKKFLLHFTDFSLFLASHYEKFLKIYSLQNEQSETFETIQDLITAIKPEFWEFFKKSFMDLIEEERFNKPEFVKFIDHVVVQNYLNTAGIQAFAVMSALWSSGLFGSSKTFTMTYSQVVRKILIPRASIFNRKVLKITRSEWNYYKIFSMDKDGKKFEKRYNFVIIAEPDVSSVSFPDLKNKMFDQYNMFVMGTIEGSLNTDYCGSHDCKKISEVINLFNYQVVSLVDEEKGIWRISSRGTPTSLELDKYFTKESRMVKCVDIVRLPQYYKFWDVENVHFVLDNNFYQVNAIEWAGLSTELMAIGAKNVALLITKELSRSVVSKNDGNTWKKSN